MTGTSSVKGTWGCSRVATNNRSLWTGQPAAEPAMLAELEQIAKKIIGLQ
jgi:hypothetical protein